MRVLQISGAYAAAQKTIEDAIHTYLKANGHESYILYLYVTSQDPNIICYENKLENILRRGMIKLFGKRQSFACLSTQHLIKWMEKIKPDVVHLHVIHHGYADYRMLFAYLAKKRVPVVYTMHDMWAFTGGCYHYSDISCNGYKDGCTSCPKKTRELDCIRRKTAAHFSLKRDLYAQMNQLCFVSVSSWVSEELQKSYLRKYPQYLVWNSVEKLPEWANENCQPDSDRFRIIGVASSWGARKGIDRFFRLAEILGKDYEIVLVGNAGAEARNRAPDNVRFLGPVWDKSELYRQYAMSDLHVSMSLEETFGMTFVEAAFCGIRSMGFASTAIAGVLERVNGIAISPSDVDAMAEKIRSFRKNRTACVLNEREAVEIRSQFSTEKMAQQYLDIYSAQLR